MSDSLITIIAIFVAAILMFIFPLMATAGQQDEISQIAVQSIVTDFTNKVAQQGKITASDYDAFIQKLHATGNTYNVELEAKKLDENPGRKVTVASSDMIGENVYYSEYTSKIEDDISKSTTSTEEGKYLMKKGDYIIATVENTNITMGTQLKNFFYKIVGKDSSIIEVTVSTLVTNTGK